MKYGRVYNFSAGPAIMPEPVLEEIRDEMMNYRGSGMCVMEMSHRSKVYQQIIDEAEADLRTLMGIPDNYKVLFIQGGATLQFSAIPLNLCKNGVFDYIVTGSWSKKAAQEAKKYGKVNVVASSEDKNFSYIPDVSDLPIDDTTSTSARTRPFTAPPISSSPTPRARSWCPTRAPCSFLSPVMWLITASSMAASRRTWAPRVSPS